jgi:hypothetical protein
MRCASYFLVGIIALQVGFAAFGEMQYWKYFPDEGDNPNWLEWINRSYWIVVVGLLYFWCRADAKNRGVTIHVAISILVPCCSRLASRTITSERILPVLLFFTSEWREYLSRFASPPFGWVTGWRLTTSQFGQTTLE